MSNIWHKLKNIFAHNADQATEYKSLNGIEQQLYTASKQIKAYGQKDIVNVFFSHNDSGCQIHGAVTLSREEYKKFKKIAGNNNNFSNKNPEEHKYSALTEIIRNRPLEKQPPLFKL